MARRRRKEHQRMALGIAIGAGATAALLLAAWLAGRWLASAEDTDHPDGEQP